MAFFGLLKSQSERSFELKTRVRQGTMKINSFLAKLTRQADEYAGLARRAYQLDDQDQFKQLAGAYLQSRETINRWERYLIRLKALELQKLEAEATRDFLAGMNGLVAAILSGTQPQDVIRLQAEMEKAELHSEQLADSVACMLGDVVTRIGDSHNFSEEMLQTAVGAATASSEADQKFWEAVQQQRPETSAVNKKSLEVEKQPDIHHPSVNS